jgi:Putative MetA-pathway of phenol degradation
LLLFHITARSQPRFVVIKSGNPSEAVDSLKIHSIIFGLAWLLVIGSAHAGPPFVTDDPEPVSPGGWEINVPFTLERTPGTTEMDTPLFDLNYGFAGLQLKAEFPIKVFNEEDRGTTAGAGDLLVGVKWRFLDNQESQFQLGIYPQLLAPTGNHRRGLGQGQPAHLLPLLAQKDWGKWTLYGNVGYWWQTAADKRDYFYVGAVLEREINKRLVLGAELFGNSPTDRGSRSDVAFNLGGTWKLNDHVNLLFTGGRDIVGDTHAIAYIGLQFLTK